MKGHLFFYHVFLGVLFSTIFTVSIYTVHVIIDLDIPVWGPGLFAPVLAGSFLGGIIGIIYHLKDRKERAIIRSLKLQKILKRVSVLAHENVSIDKFINASTELIISAPFAKSKAKVGIFLTANKNRLELKSHLNLSEKVLKSCGKHGVEFGECLCGKAALERKSTFSKCYSKNAKIDNSCSVSHIAEEAKNEEHSHYIVPIENGDDVLGVIVVYLDLNHKYNLAEIDFLESLASLFGVIIRKYQSDLKIINNEIDLKEIQKLAGLGSWIYNPITETFVTSPELIKILGFDTNEHDISKNIILDQVHPSDKRKMHEEFDKAKKGSPFEIELRYVKKSKETIHVINKCRPKVLENGYVYEIKGTIFDVTELRVNESKLLKNQHLIRGVLNATPDPLCLLDLNTSELIYSNDAMTVLLKKNSIFNDKLRKDGVNIFKVYVHPEDIVEYGLMEKALREGEDFYSLVFRTKVLNDKYIWIEERLLVYDRDTKGHINQILIVIKDLDKKIKTEEKIVNLNKGLINQNKSIKKINDELDHFVYSASHDLRAPLASILGLVNLSKYSLDKDELKSYIDKIGLSVTKMDSFIMDVLNYSKNKKTAINKESLNLDSLFINVFKEVKSLNNSDIELNLTKDVKEKYIGDQLRIKNILNNVLMNACKYADFNINRRFIKVHITTSAYGCRFLIEDNGIGINSEHIDKVFDMFFRATKKSSGSGLGLFIVKEMVSKLDGTIRIESEEGVGTKVIIDLPSYAKPDKNMNDSIRTRRQMLTRANINLQAYRN